MTTVVLADNAYGTLNVAIAATDSSITLTSGHGARFPAVVSTGSGAAPLYACLINSGNVIEEIKITVHGTSSDTATIVRGVGGTTAKAWSAGDRLEARISSTVLNAIGKDYISVKDPAFGAVGDGVTNDRAAIVAADAAAAAAGGKVYFPLGAYYIGSAGIVSAGNGVVWEGQVPRFVGASLFGVEILYDGVGAAVTFGSSAGLNYRNGLDNIQIRATGAALVSASAIGLKLVNTQYFSSNKSAAKDFTAGIGLQFAPAGAGNYGASNIFKEFFTHLCQIGVQSAGTSAVIKDNATVFIGGGVLQSAAPAGSIGFDLQQYSDSYVFYATDCEGYETGYKVDGSNHLGFGARSEDCTTHVKFTTNATTSHFVRHANEGSGTAVTDTSTAHNSTFQTVGAQAFRGKLLIQPLSDTSEVFQLFNAAGTTYADWSTSGTPKMEWANGPDHIGYSDSFVTRKWKITGATGSLQFAASIIAHDQTAIPAGGTAGAGLLVSSTASFGVFFGSGPPTLAAAKGSLYLRSDGTTTNDRAYINTNGGTTWTALTTAG